MDISKRVIEKYGVECEKDELTRVLEFFDTDEYSVDTELLARGDGTYYYWIVAQRDLYEEWPGELMWTNYNILPYVDQVDKFSILVDFGEDDDD